MSTYTPSLSQKKLFNESDCYEDGYRASEYREKSFLKDVNTQNLCTFELGTHECINVLIWIFVVFQQSERQHDQNLNNDTFYRLPVTFAQGIIGTKKK